MNVVLEGTLNYPALLIFSYFVLHFLSFCCLYCLLFWLPISALFNSSGGSILAIIVLHYSIIIRLQLLQKSFKIYLGVQNEYSKIM